MKGLECAWGLAFVVVFVIVLGTLGCATLPACPAHGGPAWTELTSDHFRVRTDLDAPDATEAVRTLEETRAAMLALVWPRAAPVPGPIEIVFLRSQGELWTFLQGGAQGIRLQQHPFPPIIVIGGIGDQDQLTGLRHEVAHELSRRFLPLEPPWYSEGIATLLESTTYERGTQTARMGEISPVRLQQLQGLGRTPANELLNTRELPAYLELARFEASSWLLAHFLINQQFEAFGRFQRRLAAFERPEEAWRQEFPELSGEALDRAVDRYSTSGKYATFSLHLDVPTPTVRTRGLSDGEVHGLRALLYWAAVSPGNVRQEAGAHAEVAEALAQDPGTLDALAVDFYWLTAVKDEAARKDLAARATRAHPESWLAWLMLADVDHLKTPPAWEALMEALELAPDQPEVVSRIATANALRGRWGQVLEFSSRAIDLRAPLAVLPLHAEALARSGDCPRAAFFMERCAEMVAASEAAELRRLWREKLQPICLAAAAAKAAATPVDSKGVPAAPPIQHDQP